MIRTIALFHLMRHLVLPVSLLAMACAVQDRTAYEAWNETLKEELLRRVAEDQAVRDRLSAAMESGETLHPTMIADMRAVDSANTAWLRGAVARFGWPDRDVVGTDGAAGAFLLVQHADQDTAFQAAMLLALESAFRRGRVEGQSVALLTDRLAVARGQPQVYGTQAALDGGRVVFAPIADSAGVDMRRAEMGLPPLARYRRVLDSVYLGRRLP